MPYDPVMVKPMREELTQVGIKELTTASAVDEFMKQQKGTTLVLVNSVCGCAAGGARPGLRMALKNNNVPNQTVTVFAGQDVDATAKMRSYFADFPPSSPSMALFKDGQVVHFVPRHMIEGRSPQQVAFDLVQAFDKHCAK